MAYLIGQIFVCLLVAALLGGLLGWWLRGMRSREEVETVRAGLFEELESERAVAKETSDGLATKIADLESDLEKSKSESADTLKALEEDLAKARSKAEKAEQAESASTKKAKTLEEDLSKMRTAALASEKASSEKLALLQGDLEKVQREAESAQNKSVAKLAALQAVVTKAQDALDSAQSGSSEKVEALEAAQQEATTRIADLEAELAKVRSQADRSAAELESCVEARAELEATIKATAEEASGGGGGQQTLGFMAGAAAGAAATAEPVQPETPVKPEKPDDLKKVEGIGPKIEGLLNEDGIWTWAVLAEAEIDRLQRVLDAAGPRYRIHDPATWPEQAALADAGRWDELEALQDRLKGGRDV